MKKKPLIGCAVITAAATMTSQAALTWTGGGDGISLFQEDNWQDNGGGTPAAGTIDPNTVVTAATGGTIQISSGTGSPSNFGGNFDLGIGNNLEVGGGKTLATATSGIRVSGTGDPANSTGTISGGSTVRATFTLDVDWTIGGSSTLRLDGAGNPLNRSTVNVLDTGSVLQFNNETYADFNTEHSGKVTAGGNALVFGADPFAIEPGDNAVASAFNGASGVQINFVAVPEPDSAILIGLGGLALILRRRKN